MTWGAGRCGRHATGARVLRPVPPLTLSGGAMVQQNFNTADGAMLPAMTDPAPTTDEPLPPHYADLLRQMDAGIVGSLDAAVSGLNSTLSEAEREVSDSYQSLVLYVNSAIGQIDVDLSDAIVPVSRAIDRQIDQIYKPLVIAQEELIAQGISIPRDPLALYVINEDDTGELLMRQLQGVPFPTEVLTDDYTLQQPPADGYDPVAPTLPPPTPDVLRPEPGACDCPVATVPPCCPVPPINVTVQCPPGNPAPVGSVGSGGGGDFGPDGEPESPGLVNPTVPLTSPPPPEFPPLTLPAGGGGGGAGGGGAGGPAPEPEPAPRPVEPINTYEYTGVRFDRPEVCEDISRAVLFLKESPLARNSGADPATKPDLISSLYRTTLSYGRSLFEYTLSGFDSKAAEDQFEQSMARTGDILGGLSQARSFLSYLPPELVSDRAATWTLAFAVGTAEKIQADSGIPMGLIARPLAYLLNTLHATEIPSSEQLDAMRLTGRIDKARWTCLQKAHGNDTNLREVYFSTLHPVPTPDDIERLRLREQVSEAEARQLYQRQGITEPDRIKWQQELAKFVPGPADLVRFMVRDAFDPQVVTDFQLDKDFGQKFYGPGGADNPGPAAKWALAQGMTEDQFRFWWYSHWDIPSNTALYECLHRLRPDRPERIAWVELATNKGPDEARKALGPEPIKVTEADVQRAMEVNDMAPQWVRALMAVSYRPMSRTEAINAYMSNVWNDEQLYHNFRDNGSDEPTAREQVRLQGIARARRLANVTGVWSIRKVMNAYRAGTITRRNADLILEPLIVDAVQRNALFQSADLEISSQRRARELARWRRAFFVGEIDEPTARQKLRAFGLDMVREDEILATWDADRLGRYREPSARQILQWQQVGIIIPEDALDRLLRLGYSMTDAQRMVTQGLIARQEKVQGQIDKAQAKQERQIKTMKQARKEQTAELEKRKKELEKQQAALEKERDRVEKELGTRKPSPPE